MIFKPTQVLGKNKERTRSQKSNEKLKKDKIKELMPTSKISHSYNLF